MNFFKASILVYFRINHRRSDQKMRIDVDIMKDQFKIGNRVRVDGEVYFIRYISSPMSKKGQLIQELELEHT